MRSEPNAIVALQEAEVSPCPTTHPAARPAYRPRPSSSKKGQLPPSEVFVKNSGSDSVTVTTVIGAGANTVVASMSLPAGTYYAAANGYGINQNAALLGELRCFLRSSGDVLVAGMPGLYVPMEPNAATNINRGTFSLDVAYQLAVPGTVWVECNKGAMAQTLVAGASLSAIQVAHVTAVP